MRTGQGCKVRLFAEAESIKLIYNRLVAFEFEALAESFHGCLLLASQKVDAAELVVVVRVVGLGIESLQAESTGLFVLATFPGKAISQFGFHSR